MSEVIETKGRADHIDQLVSKRLKSRRVLLGLSQHELGEAVDVSIQQIQKYEKATNRISSGKLFSFARFLKVPVSYFFEVANPAVNQLNDVFAEDAEEYENNITSKGAHASEKEVINLIRAFNEVKNSQVRKKFLELLKSMS